MYSNGNSFGDSAACGMADGSALSAGPMTAADPIRTIWEQVFAANEAACIQRMCNLP